MRQVFSSARLENVEAVAQLLREADIEVRVTDGRSYKGSRRGDFSYSDDTSPKPAVWVVQSDDQVRARAILRDAGLIDSTRPGESFITPTFRFEEQARTKTPAQKRAFRIKMGLLAGIVVVLVLAIMRTVNQSAAPELASPPFDGTVASTLDAVAIAVLTEEIPKAVMPVACIAVDGKNAPQSVMRSLRSEDRTLVPSSHCARVADAEKGSYHGSSGREAVILDVHAFRPSAPDAGQVEVTAYHHRMWASYKTLEVRRVGDKWRVVRVIKHVST